MQLQSILIMLATTATPIFALPIVPQHMTVPVQSIQLHNIHQESCQQLSESIQAIENHIVSEGCDAKCQTQSNKTIAILRSAQNEFPC